MPRPIDAARRNSAQSFRRSFLESTMKIGMITDSLPGTDFDTLVETAARLELDMLEFGCGNWSSAPHLDLDRMLASESERRNFKARLAHHGIAISALNC